MTLTNKAKCNDWHDVRWAVNKNKWICFDCGLEFIPQYMISDKTLKKFDRMLKMWISLLLKEKIN